MDTSVLRNDSRVEAVYFTRYAIVVDLVDGRTISAPLTWYPRLMKATHKQRSHWDISGAGLGIHWPEIDEDLSVDGLLRGSPAPDSKVRMSKNYKSGLVL